MNQTIEEVAKALDKELFYANLNNKPASEIIAIIAARLIESNSKLLGEVEAYRKEMIEYNQGQMKLVKWLCANGFEESCENSYDLVLSQLSAQSIEIDKWQNGKFAELGDDFGENPLTLIKLLRAEIAELKADKERMDWLEEKAVDIVVMRGIDRFQIIAPLIKVRQAIDQARKV